MPLRIFTSDRGDVPSNYLPNDTAVIAGNAGFSGAVKASGNLWSQAPAGGASPAATNADIVVAVATIPTNAFDAAGRQLTVTANGGLANNSNGKRAKIIVGATSAVIGQAVTGGTVIADTGAVTAANVGWALGATISKTGATGSNTQNAAHAAGQVGAAVSSLLPPTALTLTESSPVLTAVTINCPTAATDATLWGFEGFWSN